MRIVNEVAAARGGDSEGRITLHSSQTCFALRSRETRIHILRIHMCIIYSIYNICVYNIYKSVNINRNRNLNRTSECFSRYLICDSVISFS